MKRIWKGNMPTYKLQHKSIRWPTKCAVCGGSANRTVKSACSVVTDVGFWLLFFSTTHRIASISYPICARHLWSARIAGKISARNLLNLAFGFLWALTAMGLTFMFYDWAINSNPTKAPDVAIFDGIVFILGIAVIVLSRRFTPVKLTSVTEEFLTISIKNEQYADEFQNLNASIL